MSLVITATVEDGVLKPEQPLNLPVGARVQLVVTPLNSDARADADTWDAELERLCEEAPIHSEGQRLTRDQLHERR